MAPDKKSVDPRKFPNDEFELFSIPAYDEGKPERILGSEIGSSKQILQPNDVLISRIVPHIRRAWVVPESNGLVQIGSSEWIIFRANDFYPEYLRHYLLSDQFNAQFMSTVAGVGGSLLRARPAFVAKLEITLPEIGEQIRISKILDKANAIKVTQDSAFALRRRFIDSTFEDFFGPHFVDDASFIELGELVESVRVGFVGPTSKHYRDQGVHYLRTGNVGYGPLITDGMKYISQEFHDSQNKSKLKAGDIIISRVIGDEIKCSIIPPEFDNSNCGNVVIVTPSLEMNSIFLCHLILSPYTQRKLLRRKVGSAQSVVNTKVMKKMLVPKVPIKLQEKFAAIVESITGLTDPRHLSQISFDSLIQEMLT